MTDGGDHTHNVLHESARIQQEAAALGFDWPDLSGVLDKISEELTEIRMALDAGRHEEARRELGDLLLVSVHLANCLQADPAAELSRATQRFSDRFNLVREELRAANRPLQTCSLDELDAAWERAKTRMAQRLGDTP